MDYFIGIDIGTTSTKALAFTREGRVPVNVSAGYEAISDASGRHELDPLVLLEAFAGLVREVMMKMEGQGRPAGIALSCAMHSLIAVDAEGGLLTNAITWADLRSKRYAERLKAEEAGRTIYRQTGTPIHPMSPLSKIIWLRHEMSSVFERAARFVSIKEYIWWRLFGKWQVDHSIASATGLFDIYRLNWFEPALRAAGIGAERLSEAVACIHTETLLTEWGSRSLGVPGGLPFVIGGSDGCLANLGSGAMAPGETALTIGTSGAIRMTTDAPVYDPGERIFHYVLGDKFYVSGGATNNGAVVLQWWLESVMGREDGEPDIQAEIALTEAVEAGSEGLVFLPYLQGERAPVWDADAKGIFFGIRASHRKAHFVRAIMEGICASLYQIGGVLETTVGPIRHIIASGGFTRSALWLQMMADFFNKTVYTMEGADASATGAAIIGWNALGAVPEKLRVKDRYEPDPDAHARYMNLFAVYGSLYDRLKDLMHGA